MREITYEIKDELGIHARPAGMLVKCAGGYKCSITITKEEKTVDAKRLFAIMGLAVKKGDTIKMKLDGEDEEMAEMGIKDFLMQNL